MENFPKIIAFLNSGTEAWSTMAIYGRKMENKYRYGSSTTWRDVERDKKINNKCRTNPPESNYLANPDHCSVGHGSQWKSTNPIRSYLTSLWYSRTSLSAGENSTTSRSFGRSHSLSHTAHITKGFRDSCTVRAVEVGDFLRPKAPDVWVWSIVYHPQEDHLKPEFPWDHSQDILAQNFIWYHYMR